MLLRWNICLLAVASCAHAQIPAIDWKAERAEILLHYRSLLQLDTSALTQNPKTKPSETGGSALNI
jgi:hypothetical protein